MKSLLGLFLFELSLKLSQMQQYPIEKVNISGQNFPIIFAWTKFYDVEMMKGWTKNGYLENCPYQCFYTDNRRLAFIKVEHIGATYF